MLVARNWFNLHGVCQSIGFEYDYLCCVGDDVLNVLRNLMHTSVFKLFYTTLNL